MTFKVKRKKKHKKEYDYVGDVQGSVYAIGTEVSTRANPFMVTARGLGEEPNDKIQSKKKKKTS